ncbi:hypothetical protein PM082_018979 [Marasmius tenuissimus]|nr:hypothetical protein PM082_018979 [Marasmius tenuissimus]
MITSRQSPASTWPCSLFVFHQIVVRISSVAEWAYMKPDLTIRTLNDRAPAVSWYPPAFAPPIVEAPQPDTIPGICTSWTRKILYLLLTFEFCTVISVLIIFRKALATNRVSLLITPQSTHL